MIGMEVRTDHPAHRPAGEQTVEQPRPDRACAGVAIPRVEQRPPSPSSHRTRFTWSSANGRRTRSQCRPSPNAPAGRTPAWSGSYPEVFLHHFAGWRTVAVTNRGTAEVESAAKLTQPERRRVPPPLRSFATTSLNGHSDHGKPSTRDRWRHPASDAPLHTGGAGHTRRPRSRSKRGCCDANLSRELSGCSRR